MDSFRVNLLLKLGGWYYDFNVIRFISVLFGMKSYLFTRIKLDFNQPTQKWGGGGVQMLWYGSCPADCNVCGTIFINWQLICQQQLLCPASFKDFNMWPSECSLCSCCCRSLQKRKVAERMNMVSLGKGGSENFAFMSFKESEVWPYGRFHACKQLCKSIFFRN